MCTAGEVTTPESVARVQRAGRSLSSEDVETLPASFRVVYGRLRKLNQEQGSGEQEVSAVNAR